MPSLSLALNTLLTRPEPVRPRQLRGGGARSAAAAGLVGYGFAAIIVAFVGRLEPLGVCFSSVLLSMFYIGGELAQSRLGLPTSMTSVFQGLLLAALLGSDTLAHRRLRWQRRRSP